MNTPPLKTCAMCDHYQVLVIGSINRCKLKQASVRATSNCRSWRLLTDYRGRKLPGGKDYKERP